MLDLLLGVIIIAKESTIQRLEQSIEKKLSEMKIELYDMEYRKENGEQLLRIYIDRDSGIVDLQLCSEATRAIKELIDEDTVYYDYLEVSSPGLDRVLKKDKHFARFIDQRIKVKTLRQYEGPKSIKGILKGFNDKEIRVEKESSETVAIPRSMITRVRLDPDL